MNEYMEMEVSLLHIKPRIWRRFLITVKASFHDLHTAIQLAGPWHEEHLWEFYTGKGRSRQTICMPDGQPDFITGEVPQSPDDVRITDYLHEKGDKCNYVYDFGDGWEHEIKLRKRVELKEKFVARLLDGALAFPPEDCGGVWGYERCLEVMRTPEGTGDNEIEGLRHWLNGWTNAWDLEEAKKDFDQ